MTSSLSTPATPPAAPSPGRARPDRDAAIDRMRGTVIVLMVLDHVRWFLSDARFDPTDPALTNLPLFFTRWVTHFCAPVFMVLAGVGAYLAMRRGRDARALSWFLVTRGAWLVGLELTVARFGWMFNFDYHYSSALVLWALGWCMIVLALLVRLPARAVAIVALVMIAGHDLLDGVSASSWGAWAWLWTILHVPGPIEIGTARFDVLYPLVPWIGVMAGAFVLGPVFARAAGARDRVLVPLGLTMTAAFLVLRVANGYGDPTPWTSQTAPVRTAFSFLATTKYPPSLLFLLMTLGPAFAAIPLFSSWGGRIAGAVQTLGRVPLFFWLLHVPLIHAIAVVLSWMRYGEIVPWLVDNPPVAPPPGYGYGLPVVYGVTIGVVLGLLPACRWFADLRRRRRDPWLSYL